MVVRDVEERDVGDILSLIRSKAEFDGCLDLLESKETEIHDAFFSNAPKAKAIIAESGRKVVGIATYYDI